LDERSRAGAHLTFHHEDDPMKKLRLSMEDLSVESFATSPAMAMTGTVEAHGTFRGNTCGPENTCGPQTCPPAYCVIETEFPCNGDTINCTVGCPTPGCPATGQLSCDGCTTYDYTVNAGHDSCGFCMSFESDAPQRCRCI
jgi:hypothetical protein